MWLKIFFCVGLTDFFCLQKIDPFIFSFVFSLALPHTKTKATNSNYYLQSPCTDTDTDVDTDLCIIWVRLISFVHSSYQCFNLPKLKLKPFFDSTNFVLIRVLTCDCWMKNVK